jgi:SAM-dependent methyltransferase
MTRWSHGYLAEAPYTFSYHSVQSPGHIAWVCAMAGVAWNPPRDLTVLDIGCGRGLTVNVLAASNPSWNMIGIDYNPAHVAEAQELAEKAGLANAGFAEVDLATIADAEIDQLPMFDAVSLHGVWTWVADPVRAGILRILSRRLKPGGVCYVGYNALPGFGHDAALQRLVRAFAASERVGDPERRVLAAIEQVKRLAATRPVNLPATPLLKRLTETGSPLDATYLAHEFLTEHWRPVFHEDLCADLATAKLTYVGSATLHENIPDMMFAEPGQRAVHDSMPPGPARELAKDLCNGRPLRRDIFMRGPRAIDRDAALDAMVVAGFRRMPTESPKLEVPAGIAGLDAALYEPIAAALDDGPQPLGRLRRLVPGRAPTASEILAIFSAGLVLPVCGDTDGDDLRAPRFNRALYEATRVSETGRSGLAMASTIAGTGLPSAWAEIAVAAQAEVGVPLPSPASLARHVFPDCPQAELGRATDIVADILAQRLPIWRRFGAIPPSAWR